MSKQILKLFLLSLVFSIVPQLVQAATYYVDGIAGSDTNDGTSLVTAFKTINKSVDGRLPGDLILIKGGLYREKLNLMWLSGTSTNPITIKNYDSSEVILDASPAVANWTPVAANIYKATPGYDVSFVVMDNIPMKPAVTQTNSSAGYVDTSTYASVTMHPGEFYQDNNTGELYVWTIDGNTPTSHDIGVVGYRNSSTGDAIYMWDSNYLVFENLTIRFANSYGINASGDSNSFGHYVYKNLKIIYNGHTGISMGSSSQLIDSEIAWNMMGNWPRGRYNGGTQGGDWGSGVNIANDSIAENNSIHNNGGEGMLTYMNSGETIFRGNTVYDNWSMNLYVDTAPNVSIENNLVYCTQPDMADADNNGFPTDGTVYKGLHPFGIATADEYYGGPHTNYLHDVTIKNNIVVSCRRGYGHYAQYTGSGMIRVNLLNNTIITPDYPVPGTVTPGDADNFIGISLNNYWGANSGNVIKNNIVVARHSRNYALYTQSSDVDTFATYDLSNNLWYNTASTKPIHWGLNYELQYDRTLAEWLALSGTTHGQNDLSVDPSFVTIGSFVASDNYPVSTSPVIDAGTILTDVATDYAGTIRPHGNAYDIGAYEYVSSGDLIAPSVPSGLSVL